MSTRRAFVLALAAVPLLAADETIPSMERRVFDAINFQRVAADCDPLRWSAELCLTAREHSRRMLEAGFFGHDDPVFGALAARLDRAGIAWLKCGENLSREKDFQDPVSIAVVHWMYSPGHKRNLLQPEFTFSGVGVAVRAPGTVAITQQFMLPMPDPPQRGGHH